ncbi:MAG: hypothetical protein K9H49_05380 [Bacteroidales bacterium]|nr:hypothetical protein [Bacteroidales bacterium]MCF8389554.1 hypothetical protein [Bacteroidales bacterium]
MRRVIPILIILISFSTSLFSQDYLGSWTSYLPYNSAYKIAIVNNKIFCSTNGGLFYYDDSDNSLNKFSKENGLSDSDISTIAYSKTNDVLIIAYANANLDLVYGNTIFNLPDIKRKAILGDKNIYSVYFLNDKAYLACGFGIVVIDLLKKEIKETYYIGLNGEQIKVNTVSSNDEFIFAGTDEGLFYADLNSANLIDFNNWYKHTKFSNSNDIISSLAAENGTVFLVWRSTSAGEDSIYYNRNGSWEPYPYFQRSIIQSIACNNARLVVCSRYDLDVINETGQVVKHMYVGNPACANYDDNDVMWIADKAVGLIKNPGGGEKINLVPEGPAGLSIAGMTFSKGKLLGVAGGTTASWNNLFSIAELYEYENKDWTNWRNDSIKDLIAVKIDPLDNDHYFAASWGYGLLEFRNGELQNVFKGEPSSLQTVIPGNYYRLGGLDFDREGNLWIANGGTAKPLSVYKTNGEWKSFDIASAVNAPNMADIIVTENNHKWIILQGGKGLFVFDDKNTIENEDDDEWKKLSIVDRNGGVITNEVYSIAEDRDGNIWVGTNQGPVIYYSPYRVFSESNFYAQQIIIPRNDGSGFGDPLLGTESITSIKVDGANRKWLGTAGGGVYLVSDDGLDEIHEFNTENSPLLSNTITDIEIDDKTGEVFFGTESGIISYIGDATLPDDVFSDVYVFPNPVREDYFGDIVISGLIENTFVKVTDLNGNIVFETTSLGGQALWDGFNYAGDRVATGVYLVFCTSEDGLLTTVTKLLFIH